MIGDHSQAAPTSGLDPIGRMKVSEIIQRPKSEGKTVFFSSHELHKAPKWPPVRSGSHGKGKCRIHQLPPHERRLRTSLCIGNNHEGSIPFTRSIHHPVM